MQISWYCSVLVILGLFAGGCGSKPPIGTTLTDLIAESNDYNVDPLIDFHENISINGLLLQPQVGSHWYTAKKPGWLSRLRGVNSRSSPAFAIGISSRLEQPSFCLFGQTPSVPLTEVNKVKSTIEAIQAITVKGIGITVDAALAKAALRKLETDSSLNEVEKTTQKQALEKRINDLNAAKTEVDKELAVSLQTYRDTVAKNPGLIVTRWTVKKSSGGSAKTNLFDTSVSKSETTSGYLVLGGVRVASLYLGDDFRSYVKIIEPHERRLFDQLGFTTYLIQTKSLAYTNALDLQQSFAAALSVKISSLADWNTLVSEMDKITIGAYFDTAMNLDNTGSATEATWYVRERPMVEYRPATDDDRKRLPPLKSEDHVWIRVMPAETFLLEKPIANQPTTEPRIHRLYDNDWYTVVAVTANAPRVYKAFREATKGAPLPAVYELDERSFMLIDRHSGRIKRVVDDNAN
jgi:hypothetical protein